MAGIRNRVMDTVSAKLLTPPKPLILTLSFKITKNAAVC